MIPPVPALADYGISPDHGFLPPELPLDVLPDPYYGQWESIVANLQGLLLSKRLRQVIDRLSVLSTEYLHTDAEWRRAYTVLIFMLHGYVWGGDKPAERIPPQVTIPLFEVCKRLELPPVATYAGLCLWNYRPIFPDEPADDLNNISCINTFTGSMDEQWFYLVSVAIEARAAPSIPLMLQAISAARVGHTSVVIECLQDFAEILDEAGTILQRMYENCDPHVFYHRIRPFLAGSRNMQDAGLPNGLFYDDGSGKKEYRQYGGGSNAQSSIIQFFDIVLGVEHRPTGVTRSDRDDNAADGAAPKARHNFIHEMREYMPGPHRRFLEHVTSVANIREYVEARRSDRALSTAYDACLAMLRELRDKHIQMVSRYIIIKSRQSRTQSRSISPRRPGAMNIANTRQGDSSNKPGGKKLRGTGGTALIPFLKQARDETGEPAIDAWARRMLSNGPAGSSFASLGKVDEHADGHIEIVGMAGTWAMDDSEGGICHW
ncbi:Indoleamine 2,3-dioxygenase [Paecilomyces lecythidis]